MNSPKSSKTRESSDSKIKLELLRGKRLYSQGRLDEARVTGEAIIGRAPECAAAWHLLGMIAIVRKDHDQAIQFLSKALKFDPIDPAFHQHMAVVYGRLGDFEKAANHYRTAIALYPGYAEAYFNLSRIVKFKAGDPFEGAISQRLNVDGGSEADRSFLHFAAGKYYDDIGETDEAFDHYRKANDARNAKFDFGTLPLSLRQTRTTISGEWINSHSNTSCKSQLPIFIVGMPRSGTSLVEQILAAHPSVAAGGERHDISEIVNALSINDPSRRPFPECLIGTNSNLLRPYADEYLRRLKKLAPEAERVTNKNPTDFRYLGLIAGMFPHARILDIRRDSRDTCLSCYFQNFRNGQEYSFDLRGVGLYYRYYEEMMQHWWKVIPTRLLSVSYESLVTEPEPVIREILAFCGLDWHPACAEPDKAHGAVATASRWQVRRPINRASLGRWRRYEAHLGPLLEALGITSQPQTRKPQ